MEMKEPMGVGLRAWNCVLDTLAEILNRKAYADVCVSLLSGHGDGGG
jgi:hypothetical protein